MNGNHGESGLKDTGALCQQFHQRQRVFATGKPDEDFIPILYQPIFYQSLTKPLFYAADGLLFFSKLRHNNSSLRVTS